MTSGKSPDRSEPRVLIWEGNDSLPREAPLVSSELKSRRARRSAWHVVGIDERRRLLINIGTNGAIFARVSESLRDVRGSAIWWSLCFAASPAQSKRGGRTRRVKDQGDPGTLYLAAPDSEDS